MKIKIRLQLHVALTLLTAFLVCLSLVLSLHRINQSNSSTKTISDFIACTLERVAFSNDYLRNTNPSAKEQWFSKNNQIGDLIQSASNNLNNPSDKKKFNKLIEDNQSLGKIFSAIVTNRENSGSDSTVLVHEKEERLISQLIIRTYEEVSYGRQLLNSCEKIRTTALLQTGVAVIFSLLMLIAVTIISSLTISHAITGPIRLLQNGATAIGIGNLNHRIKLQNDDEFTNLSNAFNVMATKLSDSYHTLENEIAERRLAEIALQKIQGDLEERVLERTAELDRLNQELEKRVADRTAQLELTNRELESFAYSVSHDLRAPLRSIDGFSRILLEDSADQLDDDGKKNLEIIRTSTQRMGQLIDDLLQLSVITRSQFTTQPVDLSALVNTVIESLIKANPHRLIQLTIQPDCLAVANENLMRIALENLIGNAWKFSSTRAESKIEFGRQLQNDHPVYFIRDNGVGFDMKYVSKLFGAFERLHTSIEFPGTGIGLATVQRIIHRHGGKIWIEGRLNEGATVYFTIP